MRILGWGKPKIEGEIGYFGLADWWLSEFDTLERTHIEQKYQPIGMKAGHKPLTKGKIYSTTQTIGMFLSGLSSWFQATPQDRDIARRILSKAMKVNDATTDTLGFHFTCQALIKVWYRDRDALPNALEETVRACELQISIAPQAAKAFKKEYPKSPLPAHVGFEQLSVIRDKQGKYAQAISIAAEAKQQGWAGDWDKRIERYQKKQNKAKQ